MHSENIKINYQLIKFKLLYTILYYMAYKYKDVSICNFSPRSSQYININDIGYFENITGDENYHPRYLSYYTNSLFTKITSNFKVQSSNIILGKTTTSFIKCKTNIMYNEIVDALMPYSIYTYSQPSIRPVIVPPKCRNLYAILVGGGGGGAGHNASNEFNKYPGGGGGGGGVVACIINVENLAMNSHSSFQPDTNVSDPSYYGFYVTVGYGGAGGYGTESRTENGTDGAATTLRYRHQGQGIIVGQDDDSNTKIIAHGGKGGGNIPSTERNNTYYKGGAGGIPGYIDHLNRIKWLNTYHGISGETAESNNSTINSSDLTIVINGGNGGTINTTTFTSWVRYLTDNLTLPNIKSTGGVGAPRNYPSIHLQNAYNVYLEGQQATGYGGGGGGAGKTDDGFDAWGGVYRGGNGSDGIAMIFFEF